MVICRSGSARRHRSAGPPTAVRDPSTSLHEGASRRGRQPPAGRRRSFGDRLPGRGAGQRPAAAGGT